MMEADKIRTTQKYMKLVRKGYERYQTEYEACMGSLSAQRPRRTLRTRRTGSAAEWRRVLVWYACIRRAYLRLNDPTGKGAVHGQHDRVTARALQLYVFKHIDGDGLCALLGWGRTVSARYVNDRLNEAVMAVKAQAEREGLFLQEEEAEKKRKARPVKADAV